MFQRAETAGYPGPLVNLEGPAEQGSAVNKLRASSARLPFAGAASAPLAFGDDPALFGYHDLMLAPLVQCAGVDVAILFPARAFIAAWHACAPMRAI